MRFAIGWVKSKWRYWVILRSAVALKGIVALLFFTTLGAGNSNRVHY